jgi:putative ABC transport system permease protein
MAAGYAGQRLQTALPTPEVHSDAEFAAMTICYWLSTTRAGAALPRAALGVVVEVIIVTQTIYAATVERLSEFATLRASGLRTRI